MNRTAMAALSLVLVTIGLVGCERKFTRQNYDMITPDVDTKYDVRQMIGDPERDLGDQWYYEDLDRNLHARVFFHPNEVVRAKEWMDGKTGEWDGRDPDSTPPPEGEIREQHSRVRTIHKD